MFTDQEENKDEYINSKSTIKTLVLKNKIKTYNDATDYLEKDLIYLISNILTLNNFNSIKHLKLKFYSPSLLSIIIEQLTKNINGLNLYSITLYINKSQFDHILDFIKVFDEQQQEQQQQQQEQQQQEQQEQQEQPKKKLKKSKDEKVDVIFGNSSNPSSMSLKEINLKIKMEAANDDLKDIKPKLKEKLKEFYKNNNNNNIVINFINKLY